MAQPLPYLQLSEDFGGEAFGPIDRDEYRLGTAEDNEVRLTEGLGVDPHHARIARKSGDTFYVAPVQRGSTVWLYRGDRGQPEALHGPAVIRPGDGFALGTPNGIRFKLILREAPRPTGPTGPGRTSAEARAAELQSGLAEEARRRAMAGFVRTVPGRLFNSVKRFVKDRQFLSPVWIMGMLVAMSGWGVGAWRCSAELSAKHELDLAVSARQSCETQLEICRTGVQDDGNTAHLPQLVAKAGREPTYERSLGWPALADATRAELEHIFTAPTELYDRWYVGKGNRYRTASETLAKQGGMPPTLARLLAWSTVDPFRAPPEPADGPMWSVLVASDPTISACQRGPLRLTWRQATALGLDAREDTLLASGAGSAMFGQGLDAIVGQLGAGFNVTRGGAGLPPVAWTGLDPTQIVRATVSATDTCYGAPGVDERDDPGMVAKKLGALLGADARGLPDEGADNWLSARVARLYALHLKGSAGAKLSLDVAAMETAFQPLTTDDPGGVALVAERTGRTLARAVAIPCVIVLQGGDAFPEHLGEPPDFDACALLSARATYKRW